MSQISRNGAERRGGLYATYAIKYLIPRSHSYSLCLTLRLQWYNLSAAMHVVTPRVCSHAWLVRPRNKCVKPWSIEWDKLINTHLSYPRPWFKKSVSYNIALLKICQSGLSEWNRLWLTDPRTKLIFHCTVCLCALWQMGNRQFHRSCAQVLGKWTICSNVRRVFPFLNLLV